MIPVRPDDREMRLMYQILFNAFLEIRMYADGSQNTAVYRIADLFHNVTNDLAQAALNEIGYDEVLKRLVLHSQERGSEKWVEHQFKILGYSRPQASANNQLS